LEERDMLGECALGSLAAGLCEDKWYAIKAVAMVRVRMNERSVSDNGIYWPDRKGEGGSRQKVPRRVRAMPGWIASRTYRRCGRWYGGWLACERLHSG